MYEYSQLEVARILKIKTKEVRELEHSALQKIADLLKMREHPIHQTE